MCVLCTDVLLVLLDFSVSGNFAQPAICFFVIYTGEVNAARKFLCRISFHVSRKLVVCWFCRLNPSLSK